MMFRVIYFNRTIKSTLLYILLLLIINITNVASQCGTGTSTDRQDKLAIYKVILRTYWSRARFPRHYPEWRPPAQFGKLVGRTHDSTYTLYRLGERLSSGAMQYVETGRTDSLDTGGDSTNILDVFGSPGIPQGEGTTVSRAFLDGNHTLVSIMARINPSPDWFVGVDSFQLCVEGNWVDTVTVELDPLDGGTDNGFTFTAANWPTNPQGIAYRITSRYPAHPAGSFYYPNLPRLPPIATLTFTKLKEYTLTESYHEDEVEMEFITNDKLPYNSAVATPRGIDPNRDLNEAIAEERKEMDTQRYRYWTSGPTNPVVTDHPGDNKALIMDSIASSYGLGLSRSRFPVATPTSLPGQRYHVSPGSLNFNVANSQDTRTRQEIIQRKSADALMEAQKAQIYQDIQRRISNVTNNNDNNNNFNTTRSNYDNNNNVITSTKDNLHKYRMKQHRLSTKGKHYRRRFPRDCKVGDWGAWSACSRSCGVGETQRVRKITVKPRRGGAACPPLKETKWCGSVTPCPDNNNKPIVDIFSW
ncbi:uncharacterized protein LOC130671198 isoform X1 [Microplitis mediator]|uniref:uncharacterized protein LOC130671198 isoform X1 n=1 Tax=Microplitis mediator TaxID=375433 RepID=UPI0025574A3A|nr:uncharacterized protein LOC130671198 isoform X1 [Microplitis mediator]